MSVLYLLRWMLLVTAPRRERMLGWEPRWERIFSSDIRAYTVTPTFKITTHEPQQL
jgi:hypothetical protein